MGLSARKERRATARAQQQASPKPVQDAAPTKDSFQNLMTRVGVGAGSQADGASYAYNPITRKRADLDYMYRGSWIVGIAIDAVADDMVREGIDFESDMSPDDMSQIMNSMEKMRIWQALGDTIRWARLYGGAVAVMLIDGQDLSTPLRIDTITKDQFKGLFVLDRWMCLPSVAQTIQAFGPDLGKPEIYTVNADAPGLNGKKIHHTRLLRFDGITLPFWQRMAEMGWGMSVVERLYDRLVAFDSTTNGAAQLVYKAHLRTLSIEGLTQILGAGGPAMDVLAKNIEAIRKYQSSEGLTLIDAKDKFETYTYTFAGLSDVLLQFGQQISGALQIPLVRLFGQSPAGLNSSGESDLRTYYDGIKSQQEARLRGPVTRLLSVLSRSILGTPLPDGFNFSFNPLWQVSDKEKSDIAVQVTTSVSAASEAGLIDKPTAMKELRQSADVTGIFSNITDEMIEEAEMEPPDPGEVDAEQAIATPSTKPDAGRTAAENDGKRKDSVRESADN